MVYIPITLSTPADLGGSVMDYQFNACERIDTHEVPPARVFYRVLMDEMQCENVRDLMDRFKYTILMPRQIELSLDHMCEWYRDTLPLEKFPVWNGFGG